MNELLQVPKEIEMFRAVSLRKTTAKLEAKLQGAEKSKTSTMLSETCVSRDLLLAALLIKWHFNPIDEIIHGSVY
jgi:hypothetical protein